MHPSAAFQTKASRSRPFRDSRPFSDATWTSGRPRGGRPRVIAQHQHTAWTCRGSRARWDRWRPRTPGWATGGGGLGDAPSRASVPIRRVRVCQGCRRHRNGQRSGSEIARPTLKGFAQQQTARVQVASVVLKLPM